MTSPSIDITWSLAEAEAAHAGFSEIGLAHFWLSVCKAVDGLRQKTQETTKKAALREQQDYQQRIDPRTVRNRKAELRPSHPHPQRGCCQKPDLPRRPGCGPQNQTLRSLLGLISLILTLLKRVNILQTIENQQFFI